MPEFRAGKGNYTRLCQQCAKPFIKTARCQKNCPKCRGINTTKVRKCVWRVKKK